MTIQKNKKYSIVLVISVIAIWGVIGYKVISYWIDGSGASEEIFTELTADQASDFYEINSAKNVKYLKLKRNPFKLVNKQIKINKQEVKEIVNFTSHNEKKDSLQFSLKGIVFSEKNKLVTICDETTNEMLFLKTGDKYKSIKVVKILKNKVIVSEFGKKKTIEISKLN